MKNYITTLLLVLFITNSFSQVKFLKEAEKAYITKKYKKMPWYLKQVEKNGYDDLKPHQRLQFHFFQGVYLSKINPNNIGQQKKAIENFEKAKEITEKTKNYVYSKEIKANLWQVDNNIRSAAFTKSKNKEYANSAGLFNFIYKTNPKDTISLYNAGLNFYSAKKPNQAINTFNKLVNLGYTGKGKQYLATNVATGKVDVIASQKDLNELIKQGKYKNPQVKQKQSLAGSIVATLEKLYKDNGQEEKIDELYKRAINKYPNEPQVSSARSHTFFEKALSLSKEGNNQSALIEYEKALAIDPNFPEANLNIASILLEKDNSFVQQINTLTTSSADKIKYKDLILARNQNFEKAIPYLEKYNKLKPENKQIANTLLTLYKNVKSPKAATFKVN